MPAHPSFRIRFGHWLTAVLRVALPDHCALCGERSTRQLCSVCAQAWDGEGRPQRLRCLRCAAPFAGNLQAVDDVAPLQMDNEQARPATHAAPATNCRTHTPRLCGDCLVTPPAFDATIALADYGVPLSHLMIRLKYRNTLALAREFGERLGHAVSAHTSSDALVVPVPLAASRLAARGFNQSWEIARIAARTAQRPASARALRRERVTAAQSTLARSARQGNVRDAFVADARRVAGRSIVLIDDVMTTGATCDAAAHALKRAGATRVLAAVVLRTPNS